MDFDRECGYNDAGADGVQACCPEQECRSLDIDLESGDHGYICNECGATFMVP